MRTPFTIEQFLEVFQRYNLAVFPLQAVFYLVAILAVYLSLRPNTKSGKIISGLLAFLWLWMGIVYHIIFFSSVTKMAYVFGALFILQGLLFVVYGVHGDKLSFHLRSDRHKYGAAALIVYALIAYPIFGYLLGHRFPYNPTFGLPCPTTIFTLGLIVATKRIPVIITIIPLIWSLIGLSAVYNFGIVEDAGLAITAIYTIFVLSFRNSRRDEKHVHLST